MSTEAKPASWIIRHQRPLPPHQQLLSEICAETESSCHGEKCWGVHCSSAAQTHVPVCMCFRGTNLTRSLKSLALQQHACYWTRPLLWYYLHPIATVRPFPISRYGFVLLCSLNEVFPKRVMAVASTAVRRSFISSKRWTQHQSWITYTVRAVSAGCSTVQ